MKKSLLLTFIFFAFSFAAYAGCPDVSADFTADKTSVAIGEAISFTDLSILEPALGPVDSWLWDFGDGATPATSTEENPTGVSYSTPGPKTIMLTADPGFSCRTADKETKVAYITVSPQNLPVLDKRRLFLFGALIFGAAVLVLFRLNGRS